MGALVESHDTYIDEMKKGISKILVAVTLRPLWQREKDQDHFEIVKILDQKVSSLSIIKKVVILMDPADIMQEKNALGKNRSKEK